MIKEQQTQKQEEQIKCGDCEGKCQQIVLGYYDVCKMCYAKHVQQIKLIKANRTQFFPQIDQILPNLFLGNQDGANDEKLLEIYNISAILVCGQHLNSPFQQKISYKIFQIADDTRQKILHLLPEAYQWMQIFLSQQKNVLVHCAAGISRSASFVIAYLMKKNNMKLQQALNFVKAKRSIIHPNSGFLFSLKIYEKQLFTDIQQ